MEMENLKPKKHLGQHFLHDENIARKIVGALVATEADSVVEIGPGMGVLTKYLADKHPNLGLVEFDPDAVAYLGHHFPQVKVWHADFLKWNFADSLSQSTFFIGNLPYNVSSPIFFRLLENQEWVRQGVFMVQKEVAQRICAGPESKEYGILSVLLGAYFDLKYLFTVSEKVFHPRPKVLSAVFSMTRKEALPDIPFEKLAPVVKAAFGQRRKTLRNALREFPKSSELPESILSARAEQLDIPTFLEIARLLN